MARIRQMFDSSIPEKRTELKMTPEENPPRLTLQDDVFDGINLDNFERSASDEEATLNDQLIISVIHISRV